MVFENVPLPVHPLHLFRFARARHDATTNQLAQEPTIARNTLAMHFSLARALKHASPNQTHFCRLSIFIQRVGEVSCASRRDRPGLMRS
jgi:hypothetical protein